eukprot:CAMPEP_0204568032 /NCGR_PEP_ID=MMETSP0661-20131031/36939_1 /ASSEMBLY_ACC=CAM_ASM_000606 /TAXON_ID=109239 /ORGANISM="Alexandrium margalefi, Strain AMGDE01CS-322" /LENGTH=46 /DNA_ID= /DNA_START= /DNA_END= /DNA_ORIENTATION=
MCSRLAAVEPKAILWAVFELAGSARASPQRLPLSSAFMAWRAAHLL